MSFVVMLGHSSLSGTLINMTMSFAVMLDHVFLSGLLINMTMSFVVMLGHVFSFRTINHMTMSFVVMLGHVYFSGMRPVGPGCVSGQDTLLKLPSTNHVCFCSLQHFFFFLCMRPDMVFSLFFKIKSYGVKRQ